MSHESAERHLPIAAAIPALQHPLRRDPKPRLSWAEHRQHLHHLPDGQWPLGLHLPPAPRDRLKWNVDRYVDEQRRAS